MIRYIKEFISCALIAYVIKLVADVVMYMYTIFEKNDIYFDLYYLIIPQIVATVLLVAFYLMFYSKEFFGLFFKISTTVAVVANVAFAVLLCFDRGAGYIFYFTLNAFTNFINALYLKCNIIPVKKDGNIEYSPMIFEVMVFICMAMSLYSLFCGFPFKTAPNEWTYYDLTFSFKINMLAEAILVFAYIMAGRNNAEYVCDNMFIDEFMDE